MRSKCTAAAGPEKRSGRKERNQDLVHYAGRCDPFVARIFFRRFFLRD